ncbi:NRT2.2 [Scenedesmus sp. PABB004]|nr:NRT2.2 [Scenedesmus sp. PABB004]
MLLGCAGGGAGGGGVANGGALPRGAPGRAFALPVDAEGKACVLPLCSAVRPHMRAFHVGWAAFFASFAATFAPAALLPVLADALELTATDVGNAGIASMCGAIGARLAIGTAVDAWGPRAGGAIALLGTSPFAFGMALVSGPRSFVCLRMLVGLSLSMFVVNQFWATQMFNTRLLGTANALSAGWGNMGAGATLLLMPLLFEGFARVVAPGLAWRLAFLVPGLLQLVMGAMVLLAADDCPAGAWPRMHRAAGAPRARRACCAPWWSAAANYRTYGLALAYALCFGVELTTHNVATLYLYQHFGLSLTSAGLLGGCLGLMNLGSRFLGGRGSDAAARLHGMRGRLWVLQALLMVEGGACLLVGMSHESLAATLGMLFVFSFACQVACGAVFGIVPFVSRRSTGAVTGIVAAGGSLGSAVTQALFFGYADFTPYEGFYWMGTAVICLGAAVALLHWPMWGGLFCGPSPGASEERYYLSEYSPAERVAGLHLPALGFAHEARSERPPPGCCGPPCGGGLRALCGGGGGGGGGGGVQEPSLGSTHSARGLLGSALQLASPGEPRLPPADGGAAARGGSPDGAEPRLPPADGGAPALPPPGSLYASTYSGRHPFALPLHQPGRGA